MKDERIPVILTAEDVLTVRNAASRLELMARDLQAVAGKLDAALEPFLPRTDEISGIMSDDATEREAATVRVRAGTADRIGRHVAEVRTVLDEIVAWEHSA